MAETKMEKREAIRRANQLYKATVLNNHNTHFSNINAAKDVWWFDIPLEKVSSSTEMILHLLLYDDRSNELHHLRVPTSYFRENRLQLVIREKKKTISLELSAARSRLFQDVRPTAGGVRFGQFLNS
jgi:hypothetical protein